MGKLLVSLHDVTPAMEDRSKRMVEMIMEETGPSFTMLVVPDYHSAGRLDRFPEFCSWLRELHSLGVEMAQHGFTHLDFSVRKSLSGRFLTGGEGEFSTTDEKQAKKRIGEGFSVLSDALGCEPTGFTAPAWLYSRGTLEALKSFSFVWREHRSFIEYRGGIREAAPVIVFASRTRWKRYCSTLWSLVAPLVFHPFPELRAALHVRDLPFLEEEVKRILDRAGARRDSVVCGDLARTP